MPVRARSDVSLMDSEQTKQRREAISAQNAVEFNITQVIIWGRTSGAFRMYDCHEVLYKKKNTTQYDLPMRSKSTPLCSLFFFAAFTFITNGLVNERPGLVGVN